MTEVCPCCRREWPRALRVGRELEVLREWCAVEGVRLVAGRILESDLARYLDKSERTLRGWRDQERPLAFTRLGGRVLYAPEDVARYIVEHGET